VPTLLRFIAQSAPQLGLIPNDRGVTHPGGGLSNRLTRTAHEFIAKAEYAYDYGMPQWLAKLDHRAAPLHLERLFLGHQKFCHFRVWYRDRLADDIREILLDPRTLGRSVFERAAIERVVEQHLKGTHNHTLALHKLLSLELLFRCLVEGDIERKFFA
jgi:asparagine synthase (glutamine-hydrolysing)